MKLSDLLNTEIDSVTMEMGTDGFIRVKFSDEELAKINSYLKSEYDRVYDDWTPIWNESVENLETYRTVKIPIPDGGTSVYPAPIARIPADQIIASVYNSCMRPRPIFSWDAYLEADYDVPNGQSATGPDGAALPNQLAAEKQTAEKVAHRLEQGYDFVLRERVQLAQKLLRGVRGAVIGSPFWWKIAADPEQHTTIAPKSDGAVIDLNDKYEETKLRGDIVKWYLVPFTNGMMPLEFLGEENGIDLSPWYGERKPMRPDTLAKRYAAKELFLIKDDAEAAKLAASTVDQQDQFKARADVSTQKKNPTAQTQICPNWLMWFYRDVNYVDPQDPTDINGKKKLKVKRLSLLGDFHASAGALMTCWMNPNEHQCRPYELVDQMDDNDCTVGRMKYHQTMFTYAAQSEIKSAHIANNLMFWYDANSPEAANYFASHKVVAMGENIPLIGEGPRQEWGTKAAGEKHYSQLELMKFFLSMSQLDSRENEFTMGGRPPGRTPAATTAQVYQHAEEVKTMFLARLSTKLSRLLRLDAETRRQYQPLGEVLPVWSPEAKASIEIPFRFPVGDVLDNFRIALTAADDALTQEKDPQQIMMRKQALMQDGEYVAKIIAAIVDLQQPLPDTAVAAYKKIIDRVQLLTRKLMGQMVSDEENYDLTPEIEALIGERNQALAQLKQQQAMAAQNPPPPPPPQVKISLSGQLTPEQEQTAAQTVLGGQNAQSSTGSQQAPAGTPGGQAGGGTGPAQQQQPVPAPAPPPSAPVPGTHAAAPVQ